MPMYGPQAFLEAVRIEFADLPVPNSAGSGALLNAMGEFATFTQAAKVRGDWPAYESCIRLADRMFEGADATLAEAFRLAFFEQLDFEGSRGPAAWQLLTPRLQAAWKHMDAENRRLMALPQQRGLGDRPGDRNPRNPRGPGGPRGPKGHKGGPPGGKPRKGRGDRRRRRK